MLESSDQLLSFHLTNINVLPQTLFYRDSPGNEIVVVPNTSCGDAAITYDGERPYGGYYKWNLKEAYKVIVGPACPPGCNAGDSLFLNCFRCFKCCCICLSGIPVAEALFLLNFPGGKEEVIECETIIRKKVFLQLYLWKGKNEGRTRPEFLAWVKEECEKTAIEYKKKMEDQKAADEKWLKDNYGNLKGTSLYFGV